MRRALVLWAAVCLAVCLAGCGETTSEDIPAATAPRDYSDGLQALERSDWPAAVEAFTRAIEARDQRAAAYAGRGDSYLAMSREETAEGPSLKAMALRDYETALELDPDQGEHILPVYKALAEEALDAGATDEALSYLRGAAAAAAGEEAGALLAQAAALTEPILTGSVWLAQAPDSLYYEFFPDGTGRTLSPVSMEVTGALTYENEGFELVVTDDAGEQIRWTYEPDRQSYVTVVEGAPEGVLRLEETSPRRMYADLLAALRAAEADGRLNWTEEEQAAGCGALYEKAYGVLEAMAVTAGEPAEASDTLQAERARHEDFLAGKADGKESFAQACAAADGLLGQVRPGVRAAEPVLAELFPVGEDVLLDYFRLLADWTLDARKLTAPSGTEALWNWESLRNVEYWFDGGRLYFCLPGIALRQAAGEKPMALVQEGQGRFVIETPLTLPGQTPAQEELPAWLSADRWISLMDMGYSTETFYLELTFGEDMTCSDRGGYYPGKVTGEQSGQYALQGDELAMTMAAEGYSPGTYRCRLVPMGESFYVTLLTDGVVYGQAAGSAYVFCGAEYAAGVAEDLG